MRLPIVAAALVLAFHSVGAQLCNGMASFRNGRVRLGGGLTSEDFRKTYGGQLAVGAASGPFVAGTVSTVKFNGYSEHGWAASGDGGVAIDLTSAHKAQVCPEFGFTYQNGPNQDSPIGRVSNSVHDFSFGAAVGGSAFSSPGFDLVPFFRAVYVADGDDEAITGGLGIPPSKFSFHQDQGVATVGAGLVVGGILTLQPAALIPLGPAGTGTVFAFAIGLNFGK
jgi:hypothetical protein